LPPAPRPPANPHATQIRVRRPARSRLRLADYSGPAGSLGSDVRLHLENGLIAGETDVVGGRKGRLVAAKYGRVGVVAAPGPAHRYRNRAVVSRRDRSLHPSAPPAHDPLVLAGDPDRDRHIGPVRGRLESDG